MVHKTYMNINMRPRFLMVIPRVLERKSLTTTRKLTDKWSKLNMYRFNMLIQSWIPWLHELHQSQEHAQSQNQYHWKHLHTYSSIKNNIPKQRTYNHMTKPSFEFNLTDQSWNVRSEWSRCEHWKGQTHLQRQTHYVPDL